MGLAVAQYEMNLRDYWLIIRRRRLWIIATTRGHHALQPVAGRQKVPQYQGHRHRSSSSRRTSPACSSKSVVSSSDNIETQATLIKSYPVLEEVARRWAAAADGQRRRRQGVARYQAMLAGIGGKIRTNRVPKHHILEITATPPIPRKTRAWHHCGRGLPRYNKQNRNARLTEARKFIERSSRRSRAGQARGGRGCGPSATPTASSLRRRVHRPCFAVHAGPRRPGEGAAAADGAGAAADAWRGRTSSRTERVYVESTILPCSDCRRRRRS